MKRTGIRQQRVTMYRLKVYREERQRLLDEGVEEAQAGEAGMEAAAAIVNHNHVPDGFMGKGAKKEANRVRQLVNAQRADYRACGACGTTEGTLPYAMPGPGGKDRPVWLCRKDAEARGVQDSPYILRPVPTSEVDQYGGCGTNPCIICGRELKAGSDYHTTCMVEGGGGLLHPAWAEALGLVPEESHPLVRTPMGEFLVGSGCYDRHGLKHVAE